MTILFKTCKYLSYCALGMLTISQHSIADMDKKESAIVTKSSESSAVKRKTNSILFSLGRSSTIGNVDEQLTSIGYSEIEKKDSCGSGDLSLGYRRFFSNGNWSVDFEYLDLGGCSTKISSILPPSGNSTKQILDDVVSALPEYGKGFSVTANRHIRVGSLSTLELGLGAFFSKSNREANLGEEELTLSNNSTSPLLALGVRHQITQNFSIRAVARHHFREGDDIDQFSVGFTKDF